MVKNVNLHSGFSWSPECTPQSTEDIENNTEGLQTFIWDSRGEIIMHVFFVVWPTWKFAVYSVYYLGWCLFAA